VLYFDPSFGTALELLNIKFVICKVHKDMMFVLPPKRIEEVRVATLDHEPEAREVFNPKPEDVVLDVDAHIGSYTIRAAKK